MKYILHFLLLFFLILSGVSPLYAQKNTFKPELYLGAGGGTLLSNVDFVPGVPTALKQGVYGGISAKFISEKHLGVVMEVNLAQRGWKEDFGPSSEFSYSRTLNYVDVPFLWHVYIGDKTQFILNIGPKLSFLVGDNEVMNQALSDDVSARRAADPEGKIGMQYKDMSNLKKMDYGLTGGIGMGFKTPVGDFNLEGRYYFGLGDIFPARSSRQNKDDNAYFSRSASRVFEAKLTYYIRMF